MFQEILALKSHGSVCLQATHIQELESRLLQVASEAEASTKQKAQLERENIELQGSAERLSTQLADCKTRSVSDWL